MSVADLCDAANVGNVSEIVGGGQIYRCRSLFCFSKMLFNALPCGIARKIRSASGATYSSISGVESFNFTMPSQGSSIRGALSPLFEDAMSLIGIPTSTISAIVGSLYGTVEMNAYTNNYTVSFEFGLYDGANFDDSGKGVPVVFQIQPGPVYAGEGSPYTVTIAMEYQLMVIGGPDGLTGNFYYAANDCTYNATLPVREIS